MDLNFDWESSTNDYGLNILLSQMELGRQLVHEWDNFQRNGQIVLDGLKFEHLILDMFRTEFHRRFLWGRRACNVPFMERYEKFKQVLDFLSQKCESS